MIQIPPSRYLLPNLFTIAATFCGVSVIWLSAAATTPTDFYLAALLIPLAAVLDGFDGRMARLLHGESDFGVQFDSLSDFVAFGVAPAFLVYYWAFEPIGLTGLAVVFLFAAAAMTRLARFNVEAGDHADEGVSRYFTGLPAPTGAMAIACIVALDTGLLRHVTVVAELRSTVAVYVVLIGLLMISEVPFRTFKDLRFTPPVRLVVSTLLALVVIVSVTFDPMLALSGLVYSYIGIGVIASILGSRAVDRGLATFDDEEELELDGDEGPLSP